MRFTVVMPIHNEERYLPYSLPSVYRLKPDEIVLIFDRCTDNSLSVAKEIARAFRYTRKTKFVEVWEKCDWKFRLAWLRRYGYSLARNDVILTTDADNILDSKIKEYFDLIGRNGVGLIAFGRVDYPFTYQNLIALFLQKYSPLKKFTGCYVFSKKCWEETEDKERVKRILRAEDTHLHLSISARYKTKFFSTNTYHLKPIETKERHILKGRVKWSVERDPLWKAVLHSIIYLRPVVLVGYLQERFG